MNHTTTPWYRTADGHSLIRRSAIALLVVMFWWAILTHAQDVSQANNSNKSFSARTTHLLGFEGSLNNANGTLSIQGDSLQFQKDGKPAVQVPIASVENVSLGQQDKQVGGKAMTLGKAAAPFGGGRAVSLFAHKKYDTVALEYVDANGALHGALFQLNKGQGEALKNDLVAKGARVSKSDESGKQSKAEVSNENK